MMFDALPNLRFCGIVHRDTICSQHEHGHRYPHVENGIVTLGGLVMPSSLFPFAGWALASEGSAIAELFGLDWDEVRNPRLWTIIGMTGSLCPTLPRCYEIRWPIPAELGHEFSIDALGFGDVKIKCVRQRGRWRRWFTAYVPRGYPYAFYGFN